MEQKLYARQAGRTMMEMLGVLSIVGLLTLVSLWGYKYATSKYQANETVNEIRMRAADVIFQSTASGELRKGDEWGSYTSLEKPISYDLSMAPITLHGEAQHPFAIAVEGIKGAVCDKMLTMGFDMPYQVDVNGHVFDGKSTKICLETPNMMTYYFTLETPVSGIGDKDDGDSCEKDIECDSGVCHNGTCVDCADNTDCPHGVCDPTTHTCRTCLNDSDCPPDQVCDTQEDVCVACRTDSDCSNGEVCDTDVPRCVECLADTDCPNDQQCDTVQNKCFECMTNADCPIDEKGYCNLPEHTCGLCKGRCINIPLCPQIGESGEGIVKLCDSYQPTGRNIVVAFATESGTIVRMVTVTDRQLAAGLHFADIDKSATQMVFFTDNGGSLGNVTHLDTIKDYINTTNVHFANTASCVRVSQGMFGYYFESCSITHPDVTKASSIF